MSIEKNILLVIGDSFIDENWLMSKLDLYHSSHIGDEHFISMLPKPNSSIISFCGVGAIMKMLNVQNSGILDPLTNTWKLIALIQR